MAEKGIAYRLGWVLYWICLGLALALGLLVWGFTNGVVVGFVGPLNVAPLICGGLVALLVYGLGRAFRYVLAGL